MDSLRGSSEDQVFLLTYSIGQSSHRPVQIQGEEKMDPISLKDEYKEFVVICVPLKVISKFTDVTLARRIWPGYLPGATNGQLSLLPYSNEGKGRSVLAKRGHTRAL